MSTFRTKISELNLAHWQHYWNCVIFYWRWSQGIFFLYFRFTYICIMSDGWLACQLCIYSTCIYNIIYIPQLTQACVQMNQEINLRHIYSSNLYRPYRLPDVALLPIVYKVIVTEKHLPIFSGWFLYSSFFIHCSKMRIISLALNSALCLSRG